MNDHDLNGSSRPEPCAIVGGFARRDWSDDKFHEEIRGAVWESACKLGHWEEVRTADVLCVRQFR